MATPAPRPTLDSVTTIRDDGSRVFLHPADVRGRFTRWRQVTAAVLIAIYVLLPWIPVGGQPAVFLDVINRRFHLFGFSFATQDFWLFFFCITGLGFSLFFLTSLLGRVWCGWTCPQTVFLEHVFRRVERAFEGDAPKRRALDAAPWMAGKLLRRGGKHAVFLLLSFAIAHLFLSYFVSLPQLWSWMTTAPGEHWSAFVFMMITTGVLYFNFAWFREQLCIVLCPYGRLQSALTDENTIVIGYDHGRGEPRGRAGVKLPDGRAPGDCVDCLRCVNVCPTGIDIRQGLQLECIGCAACIDACDEVMVKLKRPTGLVRYSSLNALRGQATRWIRPRTILYTILLLIGAGVASYSLSTVRPAIMTTFRLHGAPFYLDPDFVRNQFLVRIINKTDVAESYVIRVEADGQSLTVAGNERPVVIDALQESVHPLIVRVPRGEFHGRFPLTVRVSNSRGEFELTKKIEFAGPDPTLLRDDHATGTR